MDRKPIVLVDGCPRELPDGDRITGAGNISLAEIPPSDPQNEDVWVSDTGSIFIYSGESEAWVQLTDPESWQNIPYQNVTGLGDLATENDAPHDGSKYLRRNGAWERAPTSSIPVFDAFGVKKFIGLVGDYAVPLLLSDGTESQIEITP